MRKKYERYICIGIKLLRIFTFLPNYILLKWQSILFPINYTALILDEKQTSFVIPVIYNFPWFYTNLTSGFTVGLIGSVSKRNIRETRSNSSKKKKERKGDIHFHTDFWREVWISPHVYVI